MNEYKVKKPKLVPYYNYASWLIGWFMNITLQHFPRKKNKQANALANLTSTLTLPKKEVKLLVWQSWVVPPIFEDEDEEEIKEKINQISTHKVEKKYWI